MKCEIRAPTAMELAEGWSVARAPSRIPATAVCMDRRYVPEPANKTAVQSTPAGESPILRSERLVVVPKHGPRRSRALPCARQLRPQQRLRPCERPPHVLRLRYVPPLRPHATTAARTSQSSWPVQPQPPSALPNPPPRPPPQPQPGPIAPVREPAPPHGVSTARDTPVVTQRNPDTSRHAGSPTSRVRPHLRASRRSPVHPSCLRRADP